MCRWTSAAQAHTLRHFTFAPDDLAAIRHERYHHPHPRVQQKLEVLWLKSQGFTHEAIARPKELKFVEEQILCANEAFPEAAVSDPIADLEVWDEWNNSPRDFPYPGRYSRLGIIRQDDKVSSPSSVGVLDVVGVFLLPPVRQSGDDARATANALAALTEMQHLSSGLATFTGHYHSFAVPTRDTQPPFRRCLILPSPEHGARRSSAPVETAAAMLVHELTTVLGREAPDESAMQPSSDHLPRVVVVPKGQAGEKIADHARRVFPTAVPIFTTAGDEIIFYRDHSGLLLTDLEQLSPEAREAYEATFNEDSLSPHKRLEVLEWRGPGHT